MCNKIEYKFKNKALYKRAMTHSSYANEDKFKKLESNERLEFLGDSILGFTTAEYIFTNYGHLPEGELTKLRSSVVCEKSLCMIARELNIDKTLLLGKGEEGNGGRSRDSILADAVEAVLAAIYLDGGMESAKNFVMKVIAPKIELAFSGGAINDYKTILQEIVQKNHQETLSYRLLGEQGPDHDKVFTVEVLLNSNIIANGEGRSKKDAEQMAAKEALRLMGH